MTAGRAEPESADPQYGRSESETCAHCGVPIENYRGRWVDAGTDDLVYCTDQDETHDGIRHETAAVELARTAQARRHARIQSWLDHYENDGHDEGWDEQISWDSRYLLVEGNVRGGVWLTTFDDPAQAADYHANQEYASEWTKTELLVDLDTGAEYWPGPATFEWQEKPAAESRGPGA